MIFVGSLKADIDKKILGVCLMIAAVVAVFIAVLSLITTKVSKNIVSGIKSGIKSLSDISNGDLTTVINKELVSRRDETGELIKGTKQLKDNLTDILKTLNNNADLLDNSSYNMDKVIENTVSEIGQIKEAINEINLSAKNEAESVQYVADEIQKLAQQSNESSEEISEILENLNNSSNNSVTTMEQVKNVINKQSEDINNTKDIFSSVSEEINNSISGIKEIEEAINNLHTAKEGISESVDKLSSVSEENEANTDMTLKAAIKVSDGVTSLKESSNNVKNIAKDINEDMKAFKL